MFKRKGVSQVMYSVGHLKRKSQTQKSVYKEMNSTKKKKNL